MAETGKRRVLVLGAGLGALSAVARLTATPELRARYEITVVTPGWRVGGKGASGRNERHHQRVEEHGLHVFFGWYHNTFRLLREVYAEWGRVPFERAFSPVYGFTWAWQSPPTGRRERFRTWVPPRNGQPGVPLGQQVRADAQGAAKAALRLFLAAGFADGQTRRRIERVAAVLERTGTREAAIRFLDFYLVAHRKIAVTTRLRLVIGLWMAIFRGLLVDERFRAGGFDALDDEELRAWLRRHGADEDEIALTRGIYTLAFAFRDGRNDLDEASDAPAGLGLRVMIAMLANYHHAPILQMEGGMGDVVFTPLYEVLAARGVRFELFHRVDRIRVKGRTIAAIEGTIQAKGRGGAYDPLIDVGGRRCWPSDPLWDRLDGGDALRGQDLERGDGLGESFVRRLGQDYDDVLLGVSIGAFPTIASELLAASPEWRRAVETTTTVATKAAQIWSEEPISSLAYEARSGWIAGDPAPIDSWADLSHLAAHERWPSPPKSIHYVCSAAVDGTTVEEVKTELRSWIRDGRIVGPGTPESIVDDPERCYVRVNDHGAERYVQTPAGSVKHRLHPAKSGFDGLWLAGDWTWSPLPCGCAEAAVQSGLMCGAAIAGEDPDLLPI
jgi:uncharacterized protein with NAD-binding domain and iron-sulfur cluster